MCISIWRVKSGYAGYDVGWGCGFGSLSVTTCISIIQKDDGVEGESSTWLQKERKEAWILPVPVSFDPIEALGTFGPAFGVLPFGTASHSVSPG